MTLGPVIKLWGFASNSQGGTPTDSEIKNAMEAVGSSLLVRQPGTVRKRHPRLNIDLSSLAKGYAVDRLGLVLESFGLSHYLVEIGGELRARGFRTEGEPWKVGVEQPNGIVEDGLKLINTHVATSGSYRNYREAVSYTHLTLPTTPYV